MCRFNEETHRSCPTCRGRRVHASIGSSSAPTVRARRPSLAVASGRISPDSGEVSLSDTDLANADPAEVATRIGLASAAVAAKIVPTQSVLDTVRSAAWGLAVAHDEEYEEVDDQRARALMDIFGVAHLVQREFSTAVGG